MIGALRKTASSWIRRALPANAPPPLRLAAAGLTAAQYGAARLRPKPRAPELPSHAAAWLREVQRNGYCVVPGYYDREACRASVSALERVFAEYPEFAQRRSDLRVFGVESASPVLRRFADDAALLALAESVLQESTINAFTLGARLDFAPGNAGSGEGWHRDSFIVQFKAILYLCDVDAGMGPFELIAGSEKLSRIVGDIVRGGLGFQQNRIEDAQTEALLAAEPARLRTFTAEAGTLLVVNTSAIHRGKPIERGTRYALTNYYVQRAKAGPAMDAHFAPVLRVGTAS